MCEVIFFLFFDLWKYVYSEGAFNTLYIEIKHKFEKNPLDKINGTKNALFSFASSNSSQFYFQFSILKWAEG